MTRIAVLSDVHGNTPALRAVLDAVQGERADVTVNLGDLASGGVDPAGTLALLRARPDVLTVRGNHERQLLTLPASALTRSDLLARAVLTDADRAWLGALPARLAPCPGVLAFHGAPDDDLCYLLHTVTPHGHLDEADDEEVVDRLGLHAGAFAVHLCGHTHLQRDRRLPGGTLVVNPGSVGWPAYRDDAPYPHVVEAGTPHARYTVVESAGQEWHVHHRAIGYDVEEAAALAERNDRPDVARALRTGRV